MKAKRYIVVYTENHDDWGFTALTAKEIHEKCKSGEFIPELILVIDGFVVKSLGNKQLDMVK